MESLEWLKREESRATKSQPSKRVRSNLLVIEVKMEEESLEDLKDGDSSDLSDGIVIAEDN